MSYILDALNKAEKERRLGTVPTLNSQHQNFIEKPKRFLSTTVIVALLLNIAIIVYYFYPQGEYESLDKQVSNVESYTKKGMTKDSLRPSTVVLQKKTAPEKLAIQINSTDDTESNIDLVQSDKDTGERASRMSFNTIPVVKTSIEKIGVEESVKPTVVANNLQKQHPIQSRTSGLVPYLTEKSTSFQNTIPELQIDVHVYSETPSNRFILINLEKYKEEDRIEKGILIEEITEEGLILSYQREKFRYPMLTK